MLDTIDRYLTKGLSRVDVPDRFRPHILPEYPPNNKVIFEEWFSSEYEGCKTDRVFLDINFTSYWVNHNYGNDLQKKQEIQEYVDSLSADKKYFCVVQYDDGVLIDWKGKDVLEFNMSKQVGVQMPLICQPHPFKFKSGKKWFANFVGNKTHHIRNSAEHLKVNSDYYISFEPHNIETYCRILHESMFTLCYRGYGSNSFRIQEAIQYGSIPVYISDEFILPYGVTENEFKEFGVLIKSSCSNIIDEILQAIPLAKIIEKQDKLESIYQSYYTYEANYKLIIKTLETECNSRAQAKPDTVIVEGT